MARALVAQAYTPTFGLDTLEGVARLAGALQLCVQGAGEPHELSSIPATLVCAHQQGRTFAKHLRLARGEQTRADIHHLVIPRASFQENRRLPRKLAQLFRWHIVD